MQEQPEQFKELVSKLVLLIPGIVIGIATKLSKLNKDRKLTWRDGIYYTCVAFSTGIVVYFILINTGNVKWTLPAMLICGRFGDEILVFIWRWIKAAIQTLLKKS